MSRKATELLGLFMLYMLFVDTFLPSFFSAWCQGCLDSTDFPSGCLCYFHLECFEGPDDKAAGQQSQCGVLNFVIIYSPLR